MQAAVLIVHLFLCLGVIGLVLMQRSEGGALGMGGGGGSLMTGRGAADVLARFTSIAGALFLLTSITLTMMASAARDDANRSIFDRAPAPITAPAAPAPVDSAPAAPVEAAPAEAAAATPDASGALTVAPPPIAAT
ncbi:MAG: preprotein translocase subunit SecG, partial [Hyphomonadaceae bacterium]|nr:preprotein translocase subunit SecG [Hyphomonadaceae bacterium]